MAKNIQLKIYSAPKSFQAILLAILALTLAATATSCRGNRAENHTGDIPEITVSIPPLEYFAKAIGGDSIAVTTLLPAGADPETFEPGVGVMRAIAQSGALATTGTLRFEETILSNLRANNPSLKTFPMSEGIALIYGTHEHHRDEPHTHSHNAGEADPHIWSSVKNARIIADNMLNAIITADPAHRDYYTRRHAALRQRLDSLDSEFASQLQGADAFLIWHPSLSYFARDYGLHQIAFNVENKETSPLQMQNSLREASGRTPSAFFIPEGTDSRRADAIAAETGIKPTAVNLMSDNWETPLRTVAETLAAAHHAKGNR